MKLTIGAFCLALSIPIALAQEKTGTTNNDCERLLRALSADRDGFITRDDWTRFLMNRDNGQDPFFQEPEESPADLQNWVDQRAALFQNLDRNHDGVLSREEWPANARSFRHLDRNGDGVVNLEEFMSYNGRFWNELFENWDTNGDGVLTKDEWLDTRESFDRVDRNHNGVIDRNEFYSRQ